LTNRKPPPAVSVARTDGDPLGVVLPAGGGGSEPVAPNAARSDRVSTVAVESSSASLVVTPASTW
jgi:hypothetical protein